jgi:hypothetical protein
LAEFSSFEIDRYQVGLDAQRWGEPPARYMRRTLTLFSTVVVQNERHEAHLYFSDNPSTDLLGVVFSPYPPPAQQVRRINVDLHNDDFAYYYEVVQTEKPLYFLYFYSSDVIPNTNAMPLLRANMGSSTEPLGEGLPDVSR